MSSDSVLGESWVVASSPTIKSEIPQCSSSSGASDPKPKSNPKSGQNDGLASSILSSSSSMSGPELIMPSIYEAPVSEASWVAPTVRPKQTNLRRRNRTSREPKTERIAEPPCQDVHSSLVTKKGDSNRSKLLERSIRALVNILLVAAISHLLVLPELVQQYQTLCAVSTISALYPSSCVPQFPTPLANHQPPSSRQKSVVSSQTRLEILLNSTLHDMAPLDNSLKLTESQLRDVEKELKRNHPGTKHELDLEFASCWQAIRIASWKFDSLKADLQSAVDSLMAAGEIRATPDSRSSSVAQDARLSTQMIRREQYLEQLTERMRSKADSLAADLATLDDHLESIESIMGREVKHASSSSTSPPAGGGSHGASFAPRHRLWTFVDTVLPLDTFLPTFLRPNIPENSENRGGSMTTPSPPLTQIFHEATTHHRPVADLARNLSERLQQTLQTRKHGIF